MVICGLNSRIIWVKTFEKMAPTIRCLRKSLKIDVKNYWEMMEIQNTEQFHGVASDI